MSWYIKVLKNYVTFDGRARRKEYWMFVLVSFIISLILGFISGVIGISDTAVNAYGLAVFLPSVAALVRRMHDTNRSGWWVICPIVNIVFACFEGDQGSNRFGPDPKESQE